MYCVFACGKKQTDCFLLLTYLVSINCFSVICLLLIFPGNNLLVVLVLCIVVDDMLSLNLIYRVYPIS